MCFNYVFISFSILMLNHVNCAYIFGYMLHNPIPDEEGIFELSEAIKEKITIESAQGKENDEFIQYNKSKIPCTMDADCQKINNKMYCDLHYGYCNTLQKEMSLCRRDAQCEEGLICMFGKCRQTPEPGYKGSRCKSDEDCKSHLCCARQHGEKICKQKLQKGQKCYVPIGGLEYSLNELCPCDTGLICIQRKKKTEEKNQVNMRSPLYQLRCSRPK